MTYDEDQRAPVVGVVEDRACPEFPCDLSASENILVLFRVSAAINSRVIDGAISGATRGRILALFVAPSSQRFWWPVLNSNLHVSFNLFFLSLSRVESGFSMRFTALPLRCEADFHVARC